MGIPARMKPRDSSMDMIRTLLSFLRELPGLLAFIRDDRSFHGRLGARRRPVLPWTHNAEQNELVLVCFSYRNDLEILDASLRSLKGAAGTAKVRFVLVSDKKASFTHSDVAGFEVILGQPILHLQTPYDHGHSGLHVFLNEVMIFHKLAAELSSATFIVKVDSDVLYLNDSLFEFLATDWQHDYFFQDVRSTFRPTRWPSYSQGGCYGLRPHVLLRASATHSSPAVLKALRAFLKSRQIRRSCAYWRLCEDILMYHHLSPFADHALNTTFFVRCPYRPKLSTYTPPRFPSIMHFERSSQFMRGYYEHFIQQAKIRS